MTHSRIPIALMAAVMGAASQASALVNGNPSRAGEKNRYAAAFSDYARGSGNRRPPGTGWSVATDRRRARKARNVARNRAAHRKSS